MLEGPQDSSRRPMRLQLVTICLLTLVLSGMYTEVSRSFMMYDISPSVSHAEADTKIHSLLLSQMLNRFAMSLTLLYIIFALENIVNFHKNNYVNME